MIASILICTNICDEHTINSINSCLRQKTDILFEVVVISNGAQRFSITKTLEQYYGNVLKIINSPQVGLTANLNEGLKHCSGKFIVRFDSDDITRDDRIEKQVGFMLKNPNVDISFSHAAIINECDRITGLYSSADPSSFWFLIFSNYVCHPTVCMKKSSISKELGYRHKFGCEDYDLWMRLYFVKGANFELLQENLICYRNFSENGFRRNPKVYLTTAFSKIEIAIAARHPKLLLGAIFSFGLALYYYIINFRWNN